jgi:hypothetical protein
MVLLKEDGKWRQASLQNYGSEADLQKLLFDSPDLIPACAASAVVREFAIPEAGFVDLLCVDEYATVTLVECKLAANGEIRRGVIGQIFAYASGLQGMSTERFAEAFANRAGTSLVAAVQERASGEVDPDDFFAALGEALASGTFRLVVAVDEITPELRRIVEFLNGHLKDSVALMALEIGYLNAGGVELLVPATYGAELVEQRRAASAGQRWTAEALNQAVDALAQPPRDFVRSLLKHAKDRGAVPGFGRGAAPSAGYYFDLDGAARSLWSLYARDEPVVALNLAVVAKVSRVRGLAMLSALRTNAYLADALPDDDDEALGKYRELKVNDLIANGVTAATLTASFDAALSA